MDDCTRSETMIRYESRWSHIESDAIVTKIGCIELRLFPIYTTYMPDSLAPSLD